MYIVKWVDFAGVEHVKKYKNIGSAIKKCFAVHGWYKNGEVIKENGTKVL